MYYVLSTMYYRPMYYGLSTKFSLQNDDVLQFIVGFDMMFGVVAAPLAVGDVVKRFACHHSQCRFVERRMLPVDNFKFYNLILGCIQDVPRNTQGVGSVLYGDQGVVIVHQPINTL